MLTLPLLALPLLALPLLTLPLLALPLARLATLARGAWARGRRARDRGAGAASTGGGCHGTALAAVGARPGRAGELRTGRRGGATTSAPAGPGRGPGRPGWRGRHGALATVLTGTRGCTRTGHGRHGTRRPRTRARTGPIGRAGNVAGPATLGGRGRTACRTALADRNWPWRAGAGLTRTGATVCPATVRTLFATLLLVATDRRRGARITSP